MTFTDSHAHLPMLAGSGGSEVLEAVLAEYERAWAMEAESAANGHPLPLLVDIGTEAGDFPGRLALLGQRPFLRYSLGIWPGMPALGDPGAALAELEIALDGAGELAAAIGECGLDYHHMEGPRGAQVELFAAQADFAGARKLPLIVHTREAFADTHAILAAARLEVPVIIHCFGYGPEEARAFLDLGCFVSFAGNFTYRKASALREALALVPEERLLLETDAPYMNPEPRRGKPCTPLDIERSYEVAAGLRGCGAEDLARIVSRNAILIFDKGFRR